jgi:hypothetical protein
VGSFLSSTGHTQLSVKRTLLLATLLCAGASSAARSQVGSVEDIYIARSWRVSRIPVTDYCAQSRTGFANANLEDHYTFRSTETRASDGKMTNANAGIIGNMHGCFGNTTDSTTINFYADGSLGGVSFTGKGQCIRVHTNYPEAGLSVLRCFLELSNLPAGYVGGQFTTNSVLSRALLGGPSDPPGYTTPSIVTVRLWKRRPGTAPERFLERAWSVRPN